MWVMKLLETEGKKTTKVLGRIQAIDSLDKKGKLEHPVGLLQSRVHPDHRVSGYKGQANALSSRLHPG